MLDPVAISCSYESVAAYQKVEWGAPVKTYQPISADEVYSYWQPGSVENKSIQSEIPILTPPRNAPAAETDQAIDQNVLDNMLKPIVEQLEPYLTAEQKQNPGYAAPDIYAAFVFLISALLAMVKTDTQQIKNTTARETEMTRSAAQAIRNEGDTSLAFGISRGVATSLLGGTGAVIRFKALSNQKRTLNTIVDERNTRNNERLALSESTNLPDFDAQTQRLIADQETRQHLSAAHTAEKQVVGDLVKDGERMADSALAGTGEREVSYYRAEGRVDDMESTVSARTSQSASSTRENTLSSVFQAIAQFHQIFLADLEVAAHVAQKT